jgi:hypothetical protein
VEGVHDDADLGGGKLLGDVQGLAQGGDDTTVGGVDRVHRLDGEQHSAFPRVGGEVGDRVGGPGPGPLEVAVAFGQSTGNEHEGRRAQRGRLVDGAQVRLVRFLPGSLVGDGEEAAAAQ